ncbi:MAG: 3-keto-5-aminohexanoate cleavage protein [Pseudomonadota bacterium]
MTKPVIIMAAPNGARKTKSDHPNLPLTITEIRDEAVRCYYAGASILHAHVRDKDGMHVLDAGLYQELISEVHRHVPDMLIQITTEAVGCYSPEQQIDVVKRVMPQMVSVALREMAPDENSIKLAQKFYHWANNENIHVQHILYDAEDVTRFLELQRLGVIPFEQNCVLYVLGQYADKQVATSQDLLPFLQAAHLKMTSWFCCAFGEKEHDCMDATICNGGHVRIGFENNMYLANGQKADSTAELVQQCSKMIRAKDGNVANAHQTQEALFKRG